jgi:hypothetical protein
MIDHISVVPRFNVSHIVQTSLKHTEMVLRQKKVSHHFTTTEMKVS